MPIEHMGNTPTKDAPNKEHTDDSYIQEAPANIIVEMEKVVTKDGPNKEHTDDIDDSYIQEAPADIIAETETAVTTPKKRHKFEVQWDRNLEQLRQYKLDHGDCSVPVNKSEVYGELGKWCENQKYNYKRGKLSQDRIDRLREVGFVFEANVPRSPLKKFPSYDKKRAMRIEELKEFIQQFGHSNVPPAYSVNPQLGKWVENTRGKYNRGELSEEQIRELSDAGLSFGASPSPTKYRSYAFENQWESNFKKLIEHRDKFGECWVPKRYDIQLSKWCENQKSAHRRNELSQERVNRLKDAGFSFARRRRGTSTLEE